MKHISEYLDFLYSKERKATAQGFSVDTLNPYLKDFQSFAVRIALDKARFALFEDCGLGKTLQQLEWGKHVSTHTGKPVIALAPLAVTGQTVGEGKKFNIDVIELNQKITPISGLYVNNYEQLEHIDPSLFGGVILDESSILKNHEGAYRNMIMDKFRFTDYKLACTATPSPNDPMELGNHSEFLGYMNRNEMLATYFVHDGGETAKWRLKGHAEETFWRYVNTWSLMFSKPSDIGFDDEGYILPPLNFVERQVITSTKEGKLFNDTAISATDFHKEVRLTRLDRIDHVLDIVNKSDENFIIWVEHSEEAAMLKKLIPGAVEVKGSDKEDYKKEKLLGFAKNEFRVLITKLKIASMGMNYQNCHNQIFTSPDHSFEKIYQGIRRSLRFGQLHAVNAYLITTDTMQNVIHSFNRKQAQHQLMQQQTIKYTKELYAKYYQTA